MRKTMTILGDTGKLFPDMTEILLKKDLRLLFVSEDEVENLELRSRLEQAGAVAEVEFTSCERDGCWEADIIAITQPEKASSALLKRIKEVATQKIVLAIYEDRKNFDKATLQQLLPHSKIVLLQMDSQKKKFSVSGNYPEAKDGVKELLSGAGYEVKQ